MNLVIRSRLRQYALLALSAIFILILVTRAASNWLSYIYAGDPPPRGLKDALALEGKNSEFYFLLAQFYDNYDTSESTNEVYTYYQKALELNPVNYSYWFYLADSLFMDGKKEDALFALNQATELAPGVVSLRWMSAILASKLGNEDVLVDNLKPVVAHDPERREKAFTILWQSLRNGDRILNIVPDRVLPEYLKFLIETSRLSEATAAWDKLSSEQKVSEKTFFRYVDFLIRQNDILRAKKIWASQLGDWSGVWNGDFEKSIYNRGFDWRIKNIEGVRISRTDSPYNNRSLKIEMDGKHNIDFKHLTQIVPVQENTKYKLTALMKSKDLSTSNGFFWEAYCYNNKGLKAESEQVLGTVDLRPVTMSFTTPRNCRSIVIRLKREKSDKINRNIYGTLWMEKVALEQEH